MEKEVPVPEKNKKNIKISNKRISSDENGEEKTRMTQSIKNKFSIREIGGAFGDWGTLIPFIIGYITIVGFNPAGIFITLGLTNIILGIRFNLPLPVQPQKTIGTIAIVNKWSVDKTISTGFLTGIIWTGLGFTKIINKIGKKIPVVTIRAIQVGLAGILLIKSVELMWDDWILAVISMAFIIILSFKPKIPTALILTGIGIIIILFRHSISLENLIPELPTFSFYLPSLNYMWEGFIEAGLAQLLLTLTNVMIATVQLAHDLFPEKKDSFDSKTLAKNMGIMNVVNPFVGGIPLCHGSGGLAAQYAFGARYGGSMIFEGVLELILGLLFTDLLLSVFQNFPGAIFGSMLFYTAVLLGKIGITKSAKKELPLVIFGGIICIFLNITWGFLATLVIYLIWVQILKRE